MAMKFGRRAGLTVVFLAWLFSAGVCPAVMPADGSWNNGGAGATDATGGKAIAAVMDESNPAELRKLERRQALREQLDRIRRMETEGGLRAPASAQLAAVQEMSALAKTGTDRILVILVEFGGTNSFTWTPGSSYWDPFGQCNSAEYDGVNSGNAAASLKMASVHGITGATNFSYTGPLHNEIGRPVSGTDASWNTIWTPDFGVGYYSNIIAGNGVHIQYNRTDGSPVDQDFTGFSVRDYYRDASSGRYDIVADIIGWISLTNSVWWYGADPCPGARSGGPSTLNSGSIPGGGSPKSLVTDALQEINRRYPRFDWARYDGNGDGVIDRLWIIHAGMGEEDNTVMLNRTTYGEGGMWSHSSSLSPRYVVYSNGSTVISTGPYIMMPENCGIGVLAHEYGHNLGTRDLYAYNGGETSAGFWTLMADSWVGWPTGFLPPALDPWHLDNLGWLDPLVITDPAQVTTVTVGQASAFPGGSNIYRGVRIALPDGRVPLPIQSARTNEWWGGVRNQATGSMTLKQPISAPSGQKTVRVHMTYDLEANYDYLRVRGSSNGVSWVTLTNAHSATTVGFTGRASGYPAYAWETFYVDTVPATSLWLRLEYATDAAIVNAGPFVDELEVSNGPTQIFYDAADSGSDKWTFIDPWQLTDGTLPFAHNFYLQWRNTLSSGGYDQSLGSTNWRSGPVDAGLLVWYNNNNYADNEVFAHLPDWPGFGPKGRMLVVEAHPEPYRDPYWVAQGYTNEAANIYGRAQMRSAAFSLSNGMVFTALSRMGLVALDTTFRARQAVSRFSDALSAYPGAEYVARGTSTNYGPTDKKWITKRWDGSVVLPSSVFYGLRAPGYANDVLFYRISRASGGQIISNVFPNGLGYFGSYGHPGSTNGEYGWNVQILSQTSTQATLRIWNGAPFEMQPPAEDGTSSFVTWESSPGRSYGVSRSTNLGTGFTAVVAGVSGMVNTTTVAITNTTRSGFFRVGVQ